MTRILLVDDKEENLLYLTALLQGHGHQVETARHGAEALVKARQSVPDVVISDLLMPVMDGYTLLRHWKGDARLKHVPFIVYTATYTEEDDERLALNLGADAFILKPAEPDVFLARLAEVRAGTATRVPTEPRLPVGDEKTLLKSYSETLIRKLEEKMLQLEETNRALERDIAERMAAEAALREREAEFRTLSEALPQIVWIADANGDNLHANHRWVEYTGLTQEETRGRGWASVLHPEDLPRSTEAGQRARAGQGDYTVECRLRRVDGAYRWMLIRGVPFRDESGQVVKWFGTCTDVDDLKQALARIAEQAAVIDAAHDAIYLTDMDDVITYWNKGAERAYGWSAGEAIGRRSVELLRKDPAAFRAALDQLLVRGEWRGETQKQARDGRFLAVDVSWTLIRDEQDAPRAVLSISSDITDKKRLEAEFLRAQRMESIGTLAGGIAHDLNNVLAPIMMAVEVLRRHVNDEGGRNLLNTLQSSAQRGADLVRQVLSFARGVEGSRAPVNVLHIIREIQRIARDTFPKNISCVIQAPPDLWLVEGDATQLHQVFMNLSVNARDAMPGGGTLTLSLENVVLDETYSGMTAGSRPGPHVLVKVTDTGSGVPPGIRDRIFEPFFTTRELGKGTGLGLSTSQAIVKSHGGFISLYTEVGKGATFRVYLPASPAAQGGDPAPARSLQLARGNGELILVVDDDEAIRRVARRTLENFGYRVVLAANGSEAVAHYARQRGEIAAVITDMAMPIMDGPALIVALRAMNPAVRIIASSGLSSDGGMATAAGAGVEHFIPKPYTADAMLTVLKKVLEDA